MRRNLEVAAAYANKRVALLGIGRQIDEEDALLRPIDLVRDDEVQRMIKAFRIFDLEVVIVDVGEARELWSGSWNCNFGVVDIVVSFPNGAPIQ